MVCHMWNNCAVKVKGCFSVSRREIAQVVACGEVDSFFRRARLRSLLLFQESFKTTLIPQFQLVKW